MSEETEKELEGSVEVEIEDTDAKDDTKVVVAEKPVDEKPTAKDDLEEQSESVRKRIDKLTYRLREAERREQAALDYARGLKGEMDTHRNRADILDKTLVNEFDTRLKVQEALAKDKLKQSIDMNDVDGQIEAQRMMANLAVENERLRAQKVRRQQEEANPYREGPQYVPPQAEVQPDPRAEAWAERNKWFGSDEIMTQAAFHFHKKLVEVEGYDPTSNEYYAEIDRRVRTEFPHKFQSGRNTTSPVASARSAPRTDGKRQVKLTPTQVSIAKRLGVSLEEYARHAQKLNG
jgi:hypothetical protein